MKKYMIVWSDDFGNVNRDFVDGCTIDDAYNAMVDLRMRTKHWCATLSIRQEKD